MIVERHYDDETLIGLLGTNAAAGRDPHLAVCVSCSDTLDSYRAIADVLGEEAAWDLRDLRQEPVPETMAALQQVHAQRSAEMSAAETLAAELLRMPDALRINTLRRDLRYASAAVVRALVAASESSIDHTPVDAVDAARLAAQVADEMPAAGLSTTEANSARGAAWRQFAYAAFYVGDYKEAANAVEQARNAFRECVVSDYDLARVDIVDSLILSVHERHAEATATASRAAAIFEEFGDKQRYASARSAVAVSLICQLRYNEALPILLNLESHYAKELDSDTRARLLSNTALCQTELRDLGGGLNNYALAASIFEELGNRSEAVRIRYHIARLLATNGRIPEAKERLRSVRSEFQRLGMLHLAVSAGLEIAEILLTESSYDEAAALCSAALQQFRDSGLTATTQGLTALGYLHEAAAQRRATPEAARHVRSYIERLPREPELLFVAPPLPPL